MTPAETRAMYIATCRICLLAPAMRDCSRCLFNVGLQFAVVSEPTVAELTASVYGAWSEPSESYKAACPYHNDMYPYV